MKAFLLTYFVRGLIRLILATCKIEIRGLHHFHTIASQEKCIVMCWHNRLLLLPYIIWRHAGSFHYSAFVSHSRDGQLLATFFRSYPFGSAITVPHNARHTALKELIRCLEKDRHVILITPDGPRGPRYEVKPGTALAAKTTQAYVFPFSWAATRFWQLKTWDKMIIPKPFSRIVVEFGRPRFVTKEEERTTSQQAKELENILHFSGKSLYEELSKDPTRWPK